MLNKQKINNFQVAISERANFDCSGNSRTIKSEKNVEQWVIQFSLKCFNHLVGTKLNMALQDLLFQSRTCNHNTATANPSLI